MAVINDVGDKSKGTAHAVAVAQTWLGTALPPDGTGNYSSALGIVETVNVIRPLTGQLYPRGDGVP